MTVSLRSETAADVALPNQRLPNQRTVGRNSPAPECLAEYDDMSLDDLRHLRQQLNDQEGRVSYWRRILQARLDLLVDGVTHNGATIDGLNRVLNKQLRRPQRTAMLSLAPTNGSAPLPVLAELWERVIEPYPADQAAFATDLRNAALELSEIHCRLHDQLDTVTGQLVARYHSDPALALRALPTRGNGHPRL